MWREFKHLTFIFSIYNFKLTRGEQMTFILTIIIGFIFCLPILWVAKLKTEINILNDKIDFYRERAISLNQYIVELEYMEII